MSYIDGAFKNKLIDYSYLFIYFKKNFFNIKINKVHKYLIIKVDLTTTKTLKTKQNSYFV